MVASDNVHLFVMKEEETIVGMAVLATYLTPSGRKWWIEDVTIHHLSEGESCP